eukprot:5005036-Amphidinium_carterae.1
MAHISMMLIMFPSRKTRGALRSASRTFGMRVMPLPAACPASMPVLSDYTLSMPAQKRLLFGS